MYWLILSVCLASASGQTCEQRLWHEPLDSDYECNMTFAAIAGQRRDIARTWECREGERPDIPLLAAPVPPGKWA